MAKCTVSACGHLSRRRFTPPEDEDQANRHSLQEFLYYERLVIFATRLLDKSASQVEVVHGPDKRGQGGSSMFASVRAGFAAALVAFFTFTATAADKPFQRSDLADSAVRLETQIKTESGQVAKPIATLRSEAESAFTKRDFRSGMQTLAQIV